MKETGQEAPEFEAERSIYAPFGEKHQEAVERAVAYRKGAGRPLQEPLQTSQFHCFPDYRIKGSLCNTPAASLSDGRRGEVETGVVSLPDFRMLAANSTFFRAEIQKVATVSMTVFGGSVSPGSGASPGG